MQLCSAIITHPGKVRDINEDNFYFFDCTLGDASDNHCFAYKKTKIGNVPLLFAVFDGMGGMSDGDKASAIAASVTRKVFKDYEELDEPDMFSMFGNICELANDQICDEILQGSAKKMGSTASFVGLINDEYFLCNLGDSPVYILHNNQLEKISVDHNDREMYERINGVGQSDQKFSLTQHLGIFSEEMTLEPHFALGRVCDSDKILICSDGLTDMVDEDEIACILASSQNVESAVRNLLKSALEGGGKDNITIICIEVSRRKLLDVFWRF